MNLHTLLLKAKELGEKATPAPWETGKWLDGSSLDGCCNVFAPAAEVTPVINTIEPDAAFIAFARSALPLLVRIVERQQACLERYSKTQMTKTRELPNGTLTYEWPFGFGSGWATDALAECERIAEEMR